MGFWRNIGTEEKRDGYVVLSFMKTDPRYFGHIKRKVSLPTFLSPPQLKFLWDMKTPSSSLPHAENHSGFLPFLFQKTQRKKKKSYQKRALHDTVQTVYDRQPSTGHLLLLSRLLMEDTLFPVRKLSKQMH